MSKQMEEEYFVYFNPYLRDSQQSQLFFDLGDAMASGVDQFRSFDEYGNYVATYEYSPDYRNNLNYEVID